MPLLDGLSSSRNHSVYLTSLNSSISSVCPAICMSSCLCLSVLLCVRLSIAVTELELQQYLDSQSLTDSKDSCIWFLPEFGDLDPTEEDSDKTDGEKAGEDEQDGDEDEEEESKGQDHRQLNSVPNIILFRNSLTDSHPRQFNGRVNIGPNRINLNASLTNTVCLL